jgi:xanthine/CO dehydrogenase XdhC/CoxF family maturation factor
MTFEFRNLIDAAYSLNKIGEKTVLASVVALEGSSYRRPGVRMLISQSGTVIGAVSGGCVEKEVIRQAQSVFQNGIAKMMTYDGRFRLGCEGILYILLEPIFVTEEIYTKIRSSLKARKTFWCDSYYTLQAGENRIVGSVLSFGGKSYKLNPNWDLNDKGEIFKFSRELKPVFQLYIFGAEHDSVLLCKMANQVGWDVHIIAPPDEQKTIEYFPGATTFSTPLSEDINAFSVDENTAIVLMTHNFSKDLQYLLALINVKPKYFGLLGPSHRREKLFSRILEYTPDISSEFFEQMRGPAGINIGAESASEIAISIIAEILSVIREKEPMFLKDKSRGIHD